MQVDAEDVPVEETADYVVPASAVDAKTAEKHVRVAADRYQTCTL